MASETFRVHLHGSGVQYTLTPPEHEALRVTATPDSGTWPVPNGFNLQGSYDNITWETCLFVGSPIAGFYQTSPYLYLRVTGDGIAAPDNATVTVEYLDSALPSTHSTVEITNDSLPVSGSVSTTADLGQQALMLDVLADVLNELKSQTALLEEMAA